MEEDIQAGGYMEMRSLQCTCQSKYERNVVILDGRAGS